MLWKHKNIEARIWPLDHCPPHVTFVCRADRWTARIEFSMLTDAISLMDVIPEVNAPSLSLLNELANQVFRRISACRKEWWRVHEKVCIDNKGVRRIAPNVVSLGATTGSSGTVVSKSAVYEKAPGRGWHVMASIRWASGTTFEEVVA